MLGHRWREREARSGSTLCWPGPASPTDHKSASARTQSPRSRSSRSAPQRKRMPGSERVSLCDPKHEIGSLTSRGRFALLCDDAHVVEVCTVSRIVALDETVNTLLDIQLRGERRFTSCHPCNAPSPRNSLCASSRRWVPRNGRSQAFSLQVPSRTKPDIPPCQNCPSESTRAAEHGLQISSIRIGPADCLYRSRRSIGPDA